MTLAFLKANFLKHTMRFLNFCALTFISIALIYMCSCCGKGADLTHGYTSPSGRFSVEVLPKGQFDGWLVFRSKGVELSRFAFFPSIASIYWSPSEKYVGINNHSGRAWNIWIIDTSTGELVGTQLRTKDPTCNFYRDYRDDALSNQISIAQLLITNFIGKKSQVFLQGNSIIKGWASDDRFICLQDYVDKYTGFNVVLVFDSSPLDLSVTISSIKYALITDFSRKASKLSYIENIPKNIAVQSPTREIIQATGEE